MTSPPNNNDVPVRARRDEALIVVALFASALLVRALGLRLGLPFYHHWDEGWVVTSARSMLEHNNDVPTSYQYGAPLSRLIVLAVRANELLHIAPHVAYSDEVALRWIGRVIAIIISASGAIPLYFAGRSAVAGDARAGRRAGIYAAAAYAFAYELVCHGRFVATDAGLVAFAAWSLGLSGLYIQTRKLVFAITMVLAAGVAFAFKPTALPTILIPALTLMFIEEPPARSKVERYARRGLLIGAFPIFLACFFFFNPHYIDHWSSALRDLSARIAQVRDGGLPWFMVYKPGLNHLSIALWGLAGHAMSHDVPIACALSFVAVLGLVIAARRRTAVVLIAWAHAMITVVAIAWPNKAFLLRNNLIAVPAMCLGLAVGIERLSELLRRRWERARDAAASWHLAPAILLLAALIAATTRDSLKNQALSVDARLRAMDWIEKASTERSVSVAYTPTVVGKTALAANEASRTAMKRRGLRLMGEVADCAALARLGPEYVITASTRGPKETWYPYVATWPFRSCPGYTEVASFPDNPYEHSYWSAETWDGRVSAIVLRRDSAPND